MTNGLTSGRRSEALITHPGPLRLLAVGLSLALLTAFGTTDARAGYFDIVLSSSPLGGNLFGGYDQGTSYTADAATTYTNGVSTFNAEGTAVANLQTGQLNALAQANNGYSVNCGTGSSNPCAQPYVVGNASFGDSLTFLGSFTGQAVTFTATITGTWTTNCAALCVGPGAATFELLALPGGTIDANSGNELALFSSSSPSTINVGPTGNSSSPVPVTFTETATAILNGVDPTIDIAADLDLTGDAFNVGDSFVGDFLDTAAITYTAPPGVTVLSASGVFPQPVPEPASLTLFGAALVGFGAIRRRKRA